MLRIVRTIVIAWLSIVNALAAPSVQPPLSVTVTNPSDAPVPVSGTVTVTNAPGAVGAGPAPLLVTGTVNVGSDLYVRSLDPLLGISSSSKYTATTGGGSFVSSIYEVPAGKRLVLEFASVLVRSSTATGEMFSSMYYGTWPMPGPGVEPTREISLGGTDEPYKCGVEAWCLAVTTPLRLYLDAGGKLQMNTTVQFRVGADVTFHWTWSGYLIDVQ